MERHHYSPEDMDELVHRAKLPATIWAVFIVAACISAVFNDTTETVAGQVPSATASAAVAERVLANP